jgi:hypothetical protein
MGASFSLHAQASTCTTAHQNSKEMGWHAGHHWAMWLVLFESGIAFRFYEINTTLQRVPIALVHGHSGALARAKACQRAFFPLFDADLICATVDGSRSPTPIVLWDGGKQHGET